MKVILLQDVEKLGSEGDIVTVKDGYGRNYLIPQGKALVASTGTIKARQEELRQASRRREREKEEAQALAEHLGQLEVVVTARAGEENRIFGTITPQQVAAELLNMGYEVDRRRVELSEEIRHVGVYTATVKLAAGTVATVKVRVEPTDEA